MKGAITSYIDVAQMTLYAFWIFFAGLIVYLRREDKREGYPLDADRPGGGSSVLHGFPRMPRPKSFLLHDGTIVKAPRREPAPGPLNAVPTNMWQGAPADPVGDPLLAGVGPGSYVARADVPDPMAIDGTPKIQPLRVAADFNVAEEDPDPRGMKLHGADGRIGGTIVDVWVDKAEVIVRYLEVEVPADGGTRRVLVPMPLVKVGLRSASLGAVLGHQIALAPGLRDPDQVTLREEDRIVGFFGGGTLYAEPDRTEPYL